MKKIIAIILLLLPLGAAAQTYNELQNRINTQIWQDGTRFQTNTYRRFYSDTLHSILYDMLDFTNGGFLPLTLTGNTIVDIGENSLNIGGESGAFYGNQLYNPQIFQQLLSYEDDPNFHYWLLEADVSNGVGLIYIESDGIPIGFTLNSPYSAGDGAGFWNANGVGKYDADYDTLMSTDLHIPHIGWVKGYVDTAAVGGTTYTFESGLTESGDTVRLGGLLNQATVIDVHDQVFSLYGKAGSSGAITLNGDTYSAQFGGSVISRGWIITYGNDYSSRWDSLSVSNYTVPHVGWVGTHLGFKGLHTTAQSPTSTENGYILYWDNDFQRYDLKPPAPLAKYDATAAPGTGDDSGDGYSVGSIWCDVTNDDAYICVDASSGAAVWKKMTP